MSEVSENFANCELWNGVVGIVVDFLTLADAATDSEVQVLWHHWLSEPHDQDAEILETSVFVGNEELEGADRLWPVVEILDGRRFLCLPSQFSVQTADDYSAHREQVPLILAWAMTIHKAQGQTIERLKVDLKSVWAEGQVYVALSRATNSKNLQVLHFNETNVRVNKLVANFYQDLEASLEEESDSETEAAFEQSASASASESASAEEESESDANTETEADLEASESEFEED